jgi:hypothetical protein
VRLWCVLVLWWLALAGAFFSLTNPMWLSFRFALILTLHLPFLLLQRTPTYLLNFSPPFVSADTAGPDGGCAVRMHETMAKRLGKQSR